MPLHPNALTTVARLRAWLSPEAAPETAGRLSDEALEALIHRTSGAIESYCDRVLVAPAEPQTYTFDGDGRARLVLPEWPVVAVSAVSIDGDTVPQRTLDEPFGYVVRETAAWLELIGYRFTAGVGNVSVSARLGYDATLAATNRLHQRALDDRGRAGRNKHSTINRAVRLTYRSFCAIICIR